MPTKDGSVAKAIVERVRVDIALMDSVVTPSRRSSGAMHDVDVFAEVSGNVAVTIDTWATSWSSRTT